MNNAEIEKRLAIVEAKIAVLKSKVEKRSDSEKTWYKQIPKFGGNPAYEEAMRLGRKYPRAQRDFEDEK